MKITSKPIDAYINFAIENGFDMKKYLAESQNVKNWVKAGYKATATISDIELITSKEFIEAIARGIYPKEQEDSPGKFGTIHHITTEQAIAIRDNKLPEFIQTILPKK